MKSFALAAMIFVSGSFANAHVGYCEKYSDNPRFMKAIETVATRTQYSLEGLCQLPRLADIYVEAFMYTNKEGERIPHSWVTLHYSEYSCQYLVRDSDQSYTKANCYGTW